MKSIRVIYTYYKKYMWCLIQVDGIYVLTGDFIGHRVMCLIVPEFDIKSTTKKAWAYVVIILQLLKLILAHKLV